jgi:hypothetical protein
MPKREGDMQRRNFIRVTLGAAVAAASLAALWAAPAGAQEHWLIGTWIGEVKIPQEKNGTGRRMVVLSVKGEDVSLRYGLLGTEKPPIVHGSLKGNELRFSGPGTKLGDNPIVLSRNGADELAGTWESKSTGKTYPIAFKRQK